MKRLVVLMLLCSIMLVGCAEKIETHENGVPIYFLEPDGYVIASVRATDADLMYNGAYGYILEEDYQSYLDGSLNHVLVVKHPYEDGKEVAIPYGNIASINIGEYKDYRKPLIY